MLECKLRYSKTVNKNVKDVKIMGFVKVWDRCS